MRLPAIPNDWKKLPFGAFLLFWLLVTYMVPNKMIYFPTFRVPLTSVDELISLSPWTIWIYVSTYFGVAATFLLSKNDENRNDMYYTLALSATISFFFFFFIPTYIDRSFYALNWVGEPGMSIRMMQHIRETDNSVNCLPSMHVVMAWSVVIGTRGMKKWVQWPAILWSLAVIYSTMSTKQHYFLDVIAGSMLALTTLLIVRRVPKVALEELDSFSRIANQ